LRRFRAGTPNAIETTFARFLHQVKNLSTNSVNYIVPHN
jgi:hypothetical protein